MVQAKTRRTSLLRVLPVLWCTSRGVDVGTGSLVEPCEGKVLSGPESFRRSTSAWYSHVEFHRLHIGMSRTLRIPSSTTESLFRHSDAMRGQDIK